MRKIVYHTKLDKLVYLEDKATPEFWDSRWVDEGAPPPLTLNHEVVTVTRKYLPPKARILEGGCGRGEKVKVLADAGFSPVGLDFAADTVERARATYSGVDFRLGDVRKLDFDDDCFDGYWSFGVIEHFWDGYEDILSEAARVIRPGGFLFLTAPWFSPYRRRKVRNKAYPTIASEAEPENFYQFALDRSDVSERLASHGFRVEAKKGRASTISLKDDVPVFRRQIDWLFGSRGSLIKRVCRRLLVDGLDWYCGHSFLVVAKRLP